MALSAGGDRDPARFGKAAHTDDASSRPKGSWHVKKQHINSSSNQTLAPRNTFCCVAVSIITNHGDTIQEIIKLHRDTLFWIRMTLQYKTW